MEIEDDDVPTLAMMRLAEQSGAFDFWREEGEDVYAPSDRERSLLDSSAIGGVF